MNLKNKTKLNIKILLSFLVLVTLVNFPIRGKSNIEGSPINVGALIVEEVSLEKMIELCKYYQLTETLPEDDYIVFIHSDGTKIRFKMSESSGITIPLVEVMTREKPKQIEKILLGLGFKKTVEGLVRGNRYSHQITLGTITKSNPTIITFSKIKNNYKEKP